MVPDGEYLSEAGLHECCRALTHQSAPTMRNMEVPAAYGDRYLKACLAMIFQRRYPDKTKCKEVVEPLKYAEQKKVLSTIVEDLLMLSSNDVEVGLAYLHGDKKRSPHSMGSVFEALVTAVIVDKGFNVCLSFVESLLDAWLREKEGKEFVELEAYDPVTNVEQKLQAQIGNSAKDFYEYQVEPTAGNTEESAKGAFRAPILVKGAPEETKKGPVYGASKPQCKSRLFSELDSDPLLTSYMENQ